VLEMLVQGDGWKGEGYQQQQHEELPIHASGLAANGHAASDAADPSADGDADM
jgi:hypothetical protein